MLQLINKTVLRCISPVGAVRLICCCFSCGNRYAWSYKSHRRKHVCLTMKNAMLFLTPMNRWLLQNYLIMLCSTATLHPVLVYDLFCLYMQGKKLSLRMLIMLLITLPSLLSILIWWYWFFLQKKIKFTMLPTCFRNKFTCS